MTDLKIQLSIENTTLSGMVSWHYRPLTRCNVTCGQINFMTLGKWITTLSYDNISKLSNDDSGKTEAMCILIRVFTVQVSHVILYSGRIRASLGSVLRLLNFSHAQLSWAWNLSWSQTTLGILIFISRTNFMVSSMVLVLRLLNFNHAQLSWVWIYLANKYQNANNYKYFNIYQQNKLHGQYSWTREKFKLVFWYLLTGQILCWAEPWKFYNLKNSSHCCLQERSMGVSISEDQNRSALFIGSRWTKADQSLFRLHIHKVRFTPDDLHFQFSLV